MELQNLLELRKKIKLKKPKFLRRGAVIRKKVTNKWRKPRGSDSKLRLNMKGYGRKVSSGWGSPKKVRHLDKTGLKVVIVHSIKDIELINKEVEAAVISKSVGLKKKVDIVKAASSKGIKILNVKDSEKFLKKVEDQIRNRKDRKKAKATEKETKKKELKTKEKEGKKDKGELADKIEGEEKKKEEEKKEKDKILTKKDGM